MSVNDLKETKDDLRIRFKKIRAKLNKNQKIELDLEIQTRLLLSEQYNKCSTIYVYVSTDTEVETHGIISAAFANGKKVAVPRCIPQKTELEFYYITSFDDLKQGYFGLYEPVKSLCEKAVEYENSICIVPGLSFDVEGYRLGFGKGYYDRFLPSYSGVSVGLCYSSCIELELPRGHFDEPVDILITERYIRNIIK